MKRRAISFAVIVIILGIAGFAWYLHGISPRFILWRCASALNQPGGLEADISTSLFLGPFKPTVTVHVKHLTGGFDRIDAGQVVIYPQPKPGCFVFPDLKSAIQLEGDAADVSVSRVFQHWGGERLTRWLDDATKSGALKLRPPQSADGVACWVLEYDAAPSPQAESGVPEKLGFVPLAVDWKEITDSIRHVRVYVNRTTGLPAKIEFLDETRAPVLSNKITKVKQNAGLKPQDFTFTAPSDYTVVHRTLDEKAPWRTFLPPAQPQKPGGFIEQKLRGLLERQ